MFIFGSIIGDITGSAYERRGTSWQGNWQEIDLFPEKARFTDDTVLTIATADALLQAAHLAERAQALLESPTNPNFASKYAFWGNKYPDAGYGQSFRKWLKSENKEPYNSLGNGSAMRVSPVAWVAKSLDEAERLAKASANPTHNHPDGVRGAQAVASAIFLAKEGKSKEDIKAYVSGKYGYDLDRTLQGIRDSGYRFSSRCPTSVPEAIIAFLESDSFEETIRKAIWLRGDADTQAAIAGSIAQAYFKEIPEHLVANAIRYLPNDILEVCKKWQ